MFFFTYVAAIIAIGFIVSAVIIFLRCSGLSSKIFALYLFSGAVWVGANAAADVSYTKTILIITSQLAYAGGLINLFFCILLIDVLIGGRMPFFSRILIYGIPCALSIFTGFTSYAITDVLFPIDAPSQIVPGILYTYTIYLFLLGLMYSLVRLYNCIRNEKEYHRRMRLIYILIGLTIITLFELLFDLILPVLGELRYYTVGPMGSLFFAILCIYSITRHNFLDIRLVAQRGIIYSILLAFITVTFLSCLGIVDFILGKLNDISLFISTGITILLGVWSIPRIEYYFKVKTDRWFFKGNYSYADSMHNLSKILHTARTSSELVSRVEDALSKILRAESVNILLFKKHARLPLPNPDSSELAFPIKVDSKGIGVITIGPKRSGDNYSLEDIKLLETLVFQVATALERARLYQKVLRHALNLEKIVSKRTLQIKTLQESQRHTMLNLSHNLQTPLAILQSKLDRSNLLVLHDSEKKDIQQSVHFLSSFIHELLLSADTNTFSRDSKKLYVLSDLLRDIVEEVTIISSSKNIVVELDCASHIKYLGNERRMREVIINIASNAIKYMRKDGIKRIMFSLIQHKDLLLLSVEDTGIGIASSDLEKIFDRLYRAKNAPYEGRGNGLGLAIAKRNIENEGGSITVSSQYGIGSVFTISLPVLSKTK